MTLAPPRLVYLVTSLDLGGAEQQVRLLAREFARRGWVVTVVSMVAVDHLEPLLSSAGIAIEQLGMPRGIPDPRGLVHLALLLRRLRPDVVHSHMIHANLLGAVARVVDGGPALITTAHSVNEGAGWRYVGYRLTRGLVHQPTAVSGAVADELARRHAARRTEIEVVPNGIDIGAYRHDDTLREEMRDVLGVQHRFVWLAAGRLVPAKDYDTMFDALAAIRATGGHPILLIAGDGPLDDRLRRQVRERALDADIRLLGRRDDVPALMSAADAYVMSSRWEGSPMALIEAAAAALPTVATNVGGNAEVVVDGAGILVPAADATALADAMRRVMDMSPDERASMGVVGREHASAFDIGATADRWQAIYGAAMQQRRKHG